MDIAVVFIKKWLIDHSVFYFSMLADGVLHRAWTLGLLPLGLAGRKSSYLLLLPWTTTTGRSRSVAHYVVAVVETLSLGDHVWEATGIRKHFCRIAASSNKIIWDEAFLLRSLSLLVPWLIWILSVIGSLILPLSLDVDWRLGSYSVFSRCGTRFLGVTSLFGDHLSIESMRLIALHIVAHQVVVLLSQTEWIGWWSIDIMSSLFRQSLGIGTRWPLLGRAWTQAIVVVLAWTQASLSPLICFVGVRLPTSHSFSTSHDISWGLNGIVLVHLVIEGSGTNGPTGFENAKLLLI